MNLNERTKLIEARDNSAHEFARLERLIRYAKRRSDRAAQRLRVAQRLLDDAQQVSA